MIRQKLFILLLAALIITQIFAGHVDGTQTDGKPKATTSQPPHLSHINDELHIPLIPNRAHITTQFTDIHCDTRQEVQGKPKIQMSTDVPDLMDPLRKEMHRRLREKEEKASKSSKSYSEAIKPSNQRDSKLELPELEDAFYGGMSAKKLGKQPISSQEALRGTGYFTPALELKPRKPLISYQMPVLSYDAKFDGMTSAQLDYYTVNASPKIREYVVEYRQRRRR